MNIGFLFFFISLSAGASQMPSQVDRSLQIMQVNQQIQQTDLELMNKIDKRNLLETSLHEIDSTLAITRSFNFNSKTEKLKKDKLRAQNDLQQVEVDIADLRQSKKKLIDYQNIINK